MQNLFSALRNKLLTSKSGLVVKFVCWIRYYLYRLKYRFSYSFKNEYAYLKGKKKCIVFCAADYGNLGDVAITYAQTKFLLQKFPGYTVVDVPISKPISVLKQIRNVCSHDDIITLTGGGYMGDLYFRSEMLRQLIIQVFRKFRIISFPQTADFSSSILGNDLLYHAERIYSNCTHLELWARENRSFLFMKKHFKKCNIRLTPDIVMSLDKRQSLNREVITFCLRNDLEKNNETIHIVKAIENKIKNQEIVEYYDTHIGNIKLDILQRERELEKIWKQFGRSKLVITDRLHGMIFAYITGTPALVLPNNNFKINECYKWIEDCNYIKFLYSVKDVSKVLPFVPRDIEAGFLRTHHKIENVFNSILM